MEITYDINLKQPMMLSLVNCVSVKFELFLNRLSSYLQIHTICLEHHHSRLS